MFQVVKTYENPSKFADAMKAYNPGRVFTSVKAQVAGVGCESSTWVATFFTPDKTMHEYRHGISSSMGRNSEDNPDDKMNRERVLEAARLLEITPIAGSIQYCKKTGEVYHYFDQFGVVPENRQQNYDAWLDIVLKECDPNDTLIQYLHEGKEGIIDATVNKSRHYVIKVDELEETLEKLSKFEVRNNGIVKTWMDTVTSHHY